MQIKLTHSFFYYLDVRLLKQYAAGCVEKHSKIALGKRVFWTYGSRRQVPRILISILFYTFRHVHGIRIGTPVHHLAVNASYGLVLSSQCYLHLLLRVVIAAIVIT